MLFLVTDTSGKHGSVALARAGENPKSNEVHIIEESALVGGTFSAQLIPQVAALLARHSLRKTDIDAFVVVSGPGSFTGLRVGLAAIKALAETLKKPIVPVSLLEAVAVASGARGKVVAALDAGRGDVYAGEYEIADESARRLSEQVLPRDVFLSTARQPALATPDQVLAELARAAGLSVCAVEPPRAEMISRVALSKIRAGETVSPEQLEANYGRRSDAEIFVKSNS